MSETVSTASPAAAGSGSVDVGPLLAPRSIAVIGASDEPGNLGGTAVRLLQKFGFPGQVWPVHPRRPTVAGLPTFESVAALPEPVDLAVFAVAAERVAGLVAESAEAGLRHGIVWAGGFAEAGADGARLQAELESVCRETGFSILGPNCLGVINASLPMTATFASFLVEDDELLSGDISLVGQSGGLVTMAAALARKQGFGIRYAVSTGNEAVLGTTDFIHAFADDLETRVIGVYLEGSRDGAALLDALRAARAAGKPVVVLKGGSTTASAQAAAAHTGALAGEARVWEAVLREYAIQVHSLEELLDVVLHLSGAGGGVLPAGKRAVVVTFGGGSGVLSADQCALAGLSTPQLAETTREALRPLVPPTASVGNPVDLTPVTYTKSEWLACFPAALDTIGADPNVDLVLLQCGPMAQGSLAVAQAIYDYTRRSPKPVCLSWPLAPGGVPELLRERNMHVFEEYGRAIEVMGRLAEAAASLRRPAAGGGSLPVAFAWSAFVPEPAPGLVVSEHACHELLAAAGLPTARGRLARSEEEVLDAARSVGWPVVLKAISPAVTHRAAAGLLALDVAGEEDARAEYRRLVDRAAALEAPLDGIYVQHRETGGAELLVSAFRDPTFGVVVSCGAGGVMTEALDDVTLELAPVDRSRALEMLGRLRGVRGVRRVDADADPGAVADFVATFSQLAAAAPWRRFVLEVNPIKWSGDRVVAVDGLLIVEEP